MFCIDLHAMHIRLTAIATVLPDLVEHSLAHVARIPFTLLSRLPAGISQFALVIAFCICNANGLHCNCGQMPVWQRWALTTNCYTKINLAAIKCRLYWVSYMLINYKGSNKEVQTVILKEAWAIEPRLNKCYTNSLLCYVVISYNRYI